MNSDPIIILEHASIKPTSNRILVLKTLLAATSPMSLIEIEDSLATLERSSVSRVLAQLLEHDVIHAVEDGRGVSKYELCHCNDHCSINDMHVHFYCEKCCKVFCFEDITVPNVKIPAQFIIRTANYMLKGLCPNCQIND